jgi:hypothetical protein
MAVQILAQAEDMKQALTRGIDSLPDDVKEEYEAAAAVATTDARSGSAAASDRDRAIQDDDDDAQLEIVKLLDVDQDIAELENSCNQSREGGELNIFSAATTGSAVFAQTASKGNLCQSLFAQMKDLCGTVTKLAKALVLDNNCCARAVAIAAGVASLFRCRSLVNLLAKAAQAAQRLIQAIGNLIKQAWQRFLGFTQEFQAAKKLGKFVNGVKNSKVGHVASGLVSSLLPGMSSLSAGTSRS